MAGPEWVPTIDDSKIRDGAYMAVYPKGLGILLVRVAGELHAVANKCAHMACPLEGGKLEGAVLVCPCHDWRFDVRTGEFLDARAQHRHVPDPRGGRQGARADRRVRR